MWSGRSFQANSEQVTLLRQIRDAAETFLEARRDERDRIKPWHVRTRSPGRS
jgi:hypothetical protein